MIDLMSLDSNVQKGTDGKALRHFSPWSTPNSAGVNLFTKNLMVDDNSYLLSTHNDDWPCSSIFALVTMVIYPHYSRYFSLTFLVAYGQGPCFG